MTNQDLQIIRQARLRHWQLAMAAREIARERRALGMGEEFIACLDKIADRNIQTVQRLNDHFGPDDTVARDLAKLERRLRAAASLERACA